MGGGGCSPCSSLDEDGVGVSSLLGSLKSFLICIGSNHGIVSRMSNGSGVMFEGGVMVWETMSLGVPVGVVYCATGLDGDLSTVVSVGISSGVTVSGVVGLTAVMRVGDCVDITGSEVMQLGDDSLGDVRSATVSVGITVDTGMVSLMGSSTSVMGRPVRSWGRGLSRLQCANVIL